MCTAFFESNTTQSQMIHMQSCNYCLFHVLVTHVRNACICTLNNTTYALHLPSHSIFLCHTSTGWLNAYKEGGWLPSWASPGYRNCMVGTFADVVIADAIVKNVPNFDLRLAKDALLKDVSTHLLLCSEWFLVVIRVLQCLFLHS